MMIEKKSEVKSLLAKKKIVEIDLIVLPSTV